MFIEFITITACAGATYQAHQGTTSLSAKIAMVCLITCTIILVLL